MGAKCKAKTKSGEACAAYALAGGDYCYTHDPAGGAARAAARKKGGLNRQTPHRGDSSNVPDQVRNLGGVLQVLDYVLAEALALENSVTRGRLLVAVCAEYTNAIKTGELEARLLTLETILKAREEKK